MEISKQFLSNITTSPGIYKMIDKNKAIIYIGKASNLKKRINSYFNKNITSIKTHKLVENIKNVEITITTSEEDALILENNLIKKYRPKYNILLRDDKSYPYIFIDTEHKFPLIKFYRGNKKLKGKYFGPYTHVGKLRHTLNLVQKIFSIRHCENSFFKNRKKPCLQYQLKRCTAPCVGLINKDNYSDSINNAMLFLQGKNKNLIESYSKKMHIFSNQKKFEEATLVRDKISIIRKITESEFKISLKGNIDILTISVLHNKFCVDIFMIRDGINLGNKKFNFTDHQSPNEARSLNTFVKQYYLTNEPPQRIILSKKIPDANLLEKVFYKKYNKKSNIICTNKKPYSSYIDICQQNTNDRIKQLFTASSKYNMLRTISKDLKSKISIKNIISFDVSHISGRNMVGSSVWFDKNGPNKNMYRKYNLNNISYANDYAAMKYIIHRRLKRLNEEDVIPDMILVDGGKGQITQARNVLEEMSINKTILLGIVKGQNRKSENDKILDVHNNNITMTLTESTMKILQNIRNEAHRFAIISQRKKTMKQQFTSKLDNVPGIGKKRKYQILEYFGGLQEASKATQKELENVPGINKSLAQVIYTYLKN